MSIFAVRVLVSIGTGFFFSTGFFSGAFKARFCFFHQSSNLSGSFCAGGTSFVTFTKGGGNFSTGASGMADSDFFLAGAGGGEAIGGFSLDFAAGKPAFATDPPVGAAKISPAFPPPGSDPIKFT